MDSTASDPLQRRRSGKPGSAGPFAAACGSQTPSTNSIGTPGTGVHVPDGRKRILIVEDEQGVIDALAILLDIEGYRVVQANNGRTGLEQLASWECDIVLTDYSMPVMGGDEFIRSVRADPRHSDMPIILISATLAPGSAILALVDAFLPKPFPVDQLLRTIARFA
jgi:CheY-like chemotaxis protein